MKILHLSFNDSGAAGGTSVALSRLHEGIKARGAESAILCRVRNMTSGDSHRIPRFRLLEWLLKKSLSQGGINDLHAVGSFALRWHPQYRSSDVLHLHSLHSGFFNYLALPLLTGAKPTVWTLHDMWAMTGRCTYAYDCERWKTGCGRCPYPQVYPQAKRDASALEWKLKKWAYGRSNFEIVVASQWMADRLKQSIMAQFPVRVIPWGIDTDLYRPLDAAECRPLLGLPEGKKVLMFAAANSDWPNKGADLLVRALQALPETLKKQCVLLTMGKMSRPFLNSLPIPFIDLGYVEDERVKALAYAASDVFLFPTRAETFGLVAIESMACGTPVVSFRTGPIPERVIDGRTGFTAEPEDWAGFAVHVENLLSDDAALVRMRQACRSFVLENYTLKLQTERYLDLYCDMIDRRKSVPIAPAQGFAPIRAIPSTSRLISLS